jgi:hypothetical protein
VKVVAWMRMLVRFRAMMRKQINLKMRQRSLRMMCMKTLTWKQRQRLTQQILRVMKTSVCLHIGKNNENTFWFF